jgi:hypothetical protein
MASIDRKLRRSAAALGDTGSEILQWLHEPEQRAALVHAAERGLPSVAGISSAFVAKFGKNAGKTMVIRQFVGRAVKIIMEEQRYLPADTGVKLPNDQVFRTGTRYSPRSERADADGTTPLLGRIVAALNADELLQLQQLIRKALRR